MKQHPVYFKGVVAAESWSGEITTLWMSATALQLPRYFQIEFLHISFLHCHKRASILVCTLRNIDLLGRKIVKFELIGPLSLYIL